MQSGGRSRLDSAKQWHSGRHLCDTAKQRIASRREAFDNECRIRVVGDFQFGSVRHSGAPPQTNESGALPQAPIPFNQTDRLFATENGRGPTIEVVLWKQQWT